jgi:spore coat protein U-like protein
MYKRNIIAILGCAALMSSAAMATVANANISVTATVVNSCTVTGNTIPFGAYDPIAGAAVLQNETISVACTNGMDAPPVTLGQGLHAQAGSTDASPLRQLNAGLGQNLTYNLYSDAGSSIVWDNVTGIASPTPSGTAQNMIVYGKIDAGQSTAATGSYSDTVIVSVTF